MESRIYLNEQQLQLMLESKTQYADSLCDVLKKCNRFLLQVAKSHPEVAIPDGLAAKVKKVLS